MSQTINISLTDDRFAAVAAGKKDSKQSDTDYVAAYLQKQCDILADQHVRRGKAKVFQSVGLPASLASAGLDHDQESMLIEDAAAKMAANP